MNTSRRIFLKGSALAIGSACVAHRVIAQAKASKAAMQYQDEPKNDQECDACMHWIPGPKPDAPGGCKVVEGSINPKGWCAAFVKKS